MKHRIYLSDVFGKYIRRYPHLATLACDPGFLACACLDLEAPSDVTPAETWELAKFCAYGEVTEE